jgi:hypothetical protein
LANGRALGVIADLRLFAAPCALPGGRILDRAMCLPGCRWPVEPSRSCTLQATFAAKTLRHTFAYCAAVSGRSAPRRLLKRLLQSQRDWN